MKLEFKIKRRDLISMNLSVILFFSIALFYTTDSRIIFIYALCLGVNIGLAFHNYFAMQYDRMLENLNTKLYGIAAAMRFVEPYVQQAMQDKAIHPTQPCPICKSQLNPVPPGPKQLGIVDTAAESLCITACTNCNTMLEFNVERDEVTVMRPETIEALADNPEFQIFKKLVEQGKK